MEERPRTPVATSNEVSNAANRVEEEEDDLEPDEDEFDPFADQQEDPPPGPGEEGDDHIHEGEE